MSDKILKALMQLFAIIARPESNENDRRNVVEAFLSQLLNQEQINEYLNVFDEYYNIYQKKKSSKKRKKSISLSSVKVLKICTAINEELTQEQKSVVLIRLIEFIKSDPIDEGQADSDELSMLYEQENEFVETVSEVFNITTPEDQSEYLRIKEFINYSSQEIQNSSRILVVNNTLTKAENKTKHIYREGLNGIILFYTLSDSSMYVFRYLGKTEISLNGQLIQPEKVYVLPIGSTIRQKKMESLYYSDVERAYIENTDQIKTVFEVKNLEYKFKGGKIGLHSLSFTEESGTLVGIMGASGAGKSTLLNVLNGANEPSSGKILINGFNIHKDKEKVEGQIGHVSQDDLLIEELTVFQNLYYNARLCFDNYTEEQIIETVDELLKNLGLYEIRNMVVGNPLNKKISGGQRKRLNISLELIREPAVLFLDEPTSGLSSRDSENIMDLLKELAKKGKLIFVVIHQPSSDIFRVFDKLLILDTGGFLIYNGNPISAIGYFKNAIHQANDESECPHCGNVNPEQIFNIIETNVLDEYGNFTRTRKVPPKEWASLFLKNIKQFIIDSIPEDVPKISFKIPNKFRQFKVFVTRDVLSKLANTQYLVINLLESPILAFFLAFIIRYYNIDESIDEGYALGGNKNLPVYIFMSVIVSIFVGLTVSAEEIIKDRLILKRESFLNLSRSAYLMSKVVILFSLSAIQALTFVLIGNYIMGIHGMFFHYWLILFSTFSFANILGLNVSDSFKTAVTIYILIPFLVIPQMILSGIIVKFDELNPSISSPTSIPFYGEAMTARWAYEALAVHQFKENKYEKIFYKYNKVINTCNYKKDYWLTRLENAIGSCKRNYKIPEKQELVEYELELLRNEIKEEIKYNTQYKFSSLDKLFYNKLNIDVINEVKTSLKSLRSYYIKYTNNTIDAREKIITRMNKTDKLKKNYIALQNENENQSLADLLRNSNTSVKILEYNHRLFRKIDPIYQDPKATFIKAHFYAPRKMIFGIWMETFWVNLIIIWLSVISLYVTLYYRGLKRLLDSMERLFDKFSKNKDK